MLITIIYCNCLLAKTNFCYLQNSLYHSRDAEQYKERISQNPTWGSRINDKSFIFKWGTCNIKWGTFMLFFPEKVFFLVFLKFLFSSKFSRFLWIANFLLANFLLEKWISRITELNSMKSVENFERHLKRFFWQRKILEMFWRT